jgi:heptosyltransferase-2
MKILIIQTAFLGDVVLSLPMVQHLKNLLPKAKLDYLCIPHTAQVLQNNPYLNRIIEYDKHNTGIIEFFRLISRIKSEKYDIILCPHRSYRSALITHLSRAPVTIGFDINPFAFLLAYQAVYNIHEHEVERNLDLVRLVPNVNPPYPPSEKGGWINLKPELFPSEHDREVAEKLIKFIDAKMQLIAFAPCSKWFTKQIPLDKAVPLTNALIGQNFKVILLGGAEDTEYCKELKEWIPDERLVNFCGRLTPLQSAVMIEKADVLLTTDSAAMHLGASTNTPIIAIYGSTIPGFGFYPLTSEHSIIEVNGLECRPCTDHGRKKCPLGHFKCMREIEPAEVLKGVESLVVNG